ncbi:hypothetical protein ACFU8Q_26015 [Streptomyces sp. NPDC057543]
MAGVRLGPRQPGRRDEALADLDRALELDPGYAWALRQRERLAQDRRGDG